MKYHLYHIFLDINPALAALLLSYAVNSLGVLDWTMRLSAELESQVPLGNTVYEI